MTKTIKHDWLDINALHPHPNNMRSVAPVSLEVIIESMRTDGYRLEKPMLVRPHGDAYQIIGGHTRHAAAQAAGLDKAFCVIETMDDDEAILRIASDNLNDKPAWFDLCLYVARNAVKGSKLGLSRDMLVQAATGKEGRAASSDASRLGNAGDVLEQIPNVAHLLDQDRNLTNQLANIARLPSCAWSAAVDYLLTEELTARRCESEVKQALDLLAQQPDWYAPVTPTQAFMEYRQSKRLADIAKQAGELDEILNTVTIYTHSDSGEVTLVDGREYRVMNASESQYDQRAAFREAVLAGTPPNAAYATILEYTRNHSDSSVKLEPVLSQAEQEEHDKQLAEQEKHAARLRKAAQIHNGDCVEYMHNWQGGKIKLLLSDPPYGMAFQSNRRTESKSTDMIADDGDYESAMKLTANMLDAAMPHMAEDSHLILFCNDEGLFHLRDVVEAAGFTFKRILVWVKPNHSTGDLYGSFAPKKELAIHAVKGRPEVTPRRPDVFVQESKEIVTDHPTEKPVSLLTSWIECTTKDGDIVVDPFMGTGATAVAGESVGRIVYGAELDPAYHTQAVDRLLGLRL